MVYNLIHGNPPTFWFNTHRFFRGHPFQQNQLIHHDSGGSTVFFFGIRYQQNHCRMGNGELIFFPKILGTYHLYPKFLRKSVFLAIRNVQTINSKTGCSKTHFTKRPSHLWTAFYKRPFWSSFSAVLVFREAFLLGCSSHPLPQTSVSCRRFLALDPDDSTGGFRTKLAVCRDFLDGEMVMAPRITWGFHWGVIFHPPRKWSYNPILYPGICSRWLEKVKS